SLSGRVDDDLFSDTACASKVDPTVGNAVYLYQGVDLAPLNLADVYDPALAVGVPAGAISPYAAANVYPDTVNGGYVYSLGYVPAGNYTLAFSCDAMDDDPEQYDGIAAPVVTIPLPADQLTELTLTAGQAASCNLPGSGGICAPASALSRSRPSMRRPFFGAILCPEKRTKCAFEFIADAAQLCANLSLLRHWNRLFHYRNLSVPCAIAAL